MAEKLPDEKMFIPPKDDPIEDWNIEEPTYQPMSDRVVRKAKDGVLPGFLKTEESKVFREPFFFIQAADTQFGLIYNYGDGKQNDQYPKSEWKEEIRLCKATVKALNKMNPKPKFFIICGDMLDAFHAKWPDIRLKQEESFMEVFAELDKDIPLVCVCGNHDIGNHPTPKTVKAYRYSYGDDYFEFWLSGVQFIVFNSQYIFDGKRVPDETKTHEAWFDRVAREGQQVETRKHAVMFQHIPWFTGRPDEADHYFNIEVTQRMKWLRKIKDFGISKVFCGHWHRNGGSWYGKDVEVIVTTAVGCQIGPDQHGMRVVKVYPDRIEHEYVKLVDMPVNVEL